MSGPQSRAKQIVNDLRSGIATETLIEKYTISQRLMEHLLKSLAASGLISEAELSQWTSGPSDPGDSVPAGADQPIHKCSKCGYQLPHPTAPCPTCQELEKVAEGTWILDSADLTHEIPTPTLVRLESEAGSDDVPLPQRTDNIPVELPHPDLAGPTESEEDSSVKSFLHGASQGDAKLVAFLLSKGVDLNVRSKQGHTALMRAAHKGHSDVVEFLLHCRPDVEAKDPIGNTALIFAASEGHTEAAERLLESGADPNGRNNEDNSPLLFAVGANSTPIAELLLRYGADVNSVNNNGITPLMRACKKGHFDLAALLLGHGADVNVVNRHGDTALITAAFGGNTNLALLLLRAGARVDHRNVFGNTALMKAAFKGRNLVALILLGAGADPTEKDNTGMNSAQLAASGGFEEIGRLLESLSGAYTVNLPKPV
jgi:ankyrin repeat protein